MNKSIEFELSTFQNHAAADPQLRRLLNEAAQNSGLEGPETRTFATGLEPLAIWACYALFRWSQMILDARKRNLEMDSAREQVELIKQLVAEGWTREQAEKLVPSLLEGIKARGEDPALKAALDKALALAGASN